MRATMSVAVIKPGILVSLKSNVSGGVEYKRRNLDSGTLDGGAAMTKWETEKIVEDPAEHDRASKARSSALNEVRRVCVHSAFGLLCPVGFEEKLDEAIVRARKIVSDYNAEAAYTRVSIYCLKGRIASTDEEAARAIGSEVQELLERMDRSIDKLDADGIREAANKARDMQAMLSDEQGAKVSEAIAQARRAARMIVARIGKKGEDAAVVVKDIQRGAIEKARIAFLDVDLPEDVSTEPRDTMPIASPQRLDALDLGDDDGEDGPSSKAPESLDDVETRAASAEV